MSTRAEDHRRQPVICKHLRLEVHHKSVVEGVFVGPDGGEAVLAGSLLVVPGDFCGHAVFVDHDVLTNGHPERLLEIDNVLTLEVGLEITLRLSLADARCCVEDLHPNI